VNYQEFDQWLENLSDADRKYLERQAPWKKAREKAKASRSLPPGFVEKTMEILEGGSESET